MSLVNDMLKDLDRRKRLVAGAVPSVFIDDQDSGVGRVKNWKIVTLILAGIVVGIGAGFFYFQGSQQTTIDRELATNTQQAANNDESLTVGSVEQRESSLAAGRQSGVSIFADTENAEGFVLRMVSINNFPFEIITRDDYGIEVLLPGVSTISHNEVAIDGVSAAVTDEGIKISVTKQDLYDFLVYQESSVTNTIGKSLIIEGLSRINITDTKENLITKVVQSENASNEKSEMSQASAVEKESISEERAAVKTARVLSLEERDINVSKNAAALIQRGQIIDAYSELLNFIEENSEAHRSRETLATLLFAQQEYQQANVIIEQGLQLAPNYSAYKKIKARLLMLNKEPGNAASYLNNNPPTITADPEYFELLASAYQQNMEHNNAVETYQNLIRFDSQQARWWVGMGVSLEAKGEVDDAISSYQAALQNSELNSALRQYSQNRIRFLRN